MKVTRLGYVTLLVVLVFLLAPVHGKGKQIPVAAETASYTITIENFQFSPHNLEIPDGSKVIWINKDEEPHKVAEINNAFASPVLDTDQTFSYEFKSTGKFEYFCTIHPHMTGTVTVNPK